MPMCALSHLSSDSPALIEADLHSMLRDWTICKQALVMAHALWRSAKASCGSVILPVCDRQQAEKWHPCRVCEPLKVMHSSEIDYGVFSTACNACAGSLPGERQVHARHNPEGLPPEFRATTKQSNVSETYDMMTRPDLDKHVFMRVLEDRGAVELDADGWACPHSQVLYYRSCIKGCMCILENCGVVELLAGARCMLKGPQEASHCMM